MSPAWVTIWTTTQTSNKKKTSLSSPGRTKRANSSIWHITRELETHLYYKRLWRHPITQSEAWWEKNLTAMSGRKRERGCEISWGRERDYTRTGTAEEDGERGRHAANVPFKSVQSDHLSLSAAEQHLSRTKPANASQAQCFQHAKQL